MQSWFVGFTKLRCSVVARATPNRSKEEFGTAEGFYSGNEAMLPGLGRGGFRTQGNCGKNRDSWTSTLVPLGSVVVAVASTGTATIGFPSVYVPCIG